MNRIRRLHLTGDLAVDQFDHPPHETHHDPELEVAERWAIAFVRSGSFAIVSGGRVERMVAGSVFLTRPGLEFRCGHHEECPDDVCISVGFAPETVADYEHAWMRAGWVTRGTPTPRLAYAHRRLASAAESNDGFALERWAIASLSSLASDARDDRARGPYRGRAGDLDAVAHAARRIEGDPVVRRTIADRAREVGMTSARLTHAFRRYAGTSPHQYVVRWRLGAAATLLDEGASVSDACYRSGFENLSHFCRTFLRALGSRPSRWATLSVAERRRKVQDLLRRAA